MVDVPIVPQTEHPEDNEVELYRAELKGWDSCIITNRQIKIFRGDGSFSRFPRSIVCKVNILEHGIIFWEGGIMIETYSGAGEYLACKNRKQAKQILTKLKYF